MACSAMQGGAVRFRIMLGAERIGGAKIESRERSPDVPIQSLRVTHAHQAAQRPFAIRGSGVDQDARHGLTIAGIAGVDALAQTRRGVAGFRGKLAHQRMGKCVNGPESNPGEV